jgi:hypothetical protein
MYLDEWGPIAWELFHFITYSYKNHLKEYYIIFFNTIYSILPCPHCSNDIKNILLEKDNYPCVNMKNKNNIIEWFIKIHNLVNIKTKSKDRFNINDANNKYLRNDRLTINHDRISKFIKLSISTKLKENNDDFMRNMIALCHIYPVDIDKINNKLIQYSTKNIVNGGEWFNKFESIVKDDNQINIYNNIFNNTVKYDNRIINMTKCKLTNSVKNLNDNIIEYKNDNIIFISKNDKRIDLIYSYVCLEDNITNLYISGKTKNCNINIKLKSDNDSKIHQYQLNTDNDTCVVHSFANMHKAYKINLHFTVDCRGDGIGIIDTIYFI